MTIHATQKLGHVTVDQLATKRRLQDLLARRDRLAMAAAIFEAHQLGDPAEIRDLQYNVEAQLQTEYAATYERLLPEWVQRDAALAHSWETPIPTCPACQHQPSSFGGATQAA